MAAAMMIAPGVMGLAVY